MPRCSCARALASEAAPSGDGFTMAGAREHYAPDLALQPVHNDVSMHFTDLREQRAAGRVAITVLCNRAGSRSLRLNAVAFEDVAVEGEQALSFRYDGKEIAITWAEPFARGEKRVATVSYTVFKPITGLHFSAPDAHYPERPLMAYTDCETERARFWLPCVDFPAVRTTFEAHIRRPAGAGAVAGGARAREEEAHGDGSVTGHWRLDFPCPSYLFCFALGDIRTYEDGEVEGVRVSYVAASLFKEEHMRASFGETPGMLAWITKRLGHPFPFKSYSTMLVPEMGASAMENLTLVTFDESFLMDPVLGREYQHLVNLVVIHEMGHAYFGDAVVIRHFDHAWLKESWATYVECCWLQDNRSQAEFEYEMLLCANSYFAEADEEYVRPIVTNTYDSSWSMYDAHLYPGGAWRLHMLRQVCGEDAFWAGVKAYLEKFWTRTVETDDFRKCLEAESGLNLTRFFEQWVLGRGYPQLKGTLEQSEEEKTATVALAQAQESAARGVGLFDFDIDVVLIEDNGTEHRRVARFRDGASRAVLVFPGLKGKVGEVRVDPGMKVLHRLDFNPGEDVLERTLANAPGVGNRAWAACELAKVDTPKAAKALAAAMAREPFMGVRVEAARALARLPSPHAVEALAGLMEREEHPRALNPMMSCAMQVRDWRVRRAVRGVLARGDVAYSARSRALEALGAQRGADADPAKARPPPARAARRPGPAPNAAGAQEAANAAEDLKIITAALGDNGFGAIALDLLRARIGYGRERWEAKCAAITAYARCGQWQERARRDEVAEVVAEALSSPLERVRTAAVEGLVSLQAASAAGRVRATAASFAPQKRPWLERQAQALEGAGEQPAVAKLQAQLEETTARMKRMEEKLQDLVAKIGAAAKAAQAEPAPAEPAAPAAPAAS
eukprot:tig00000670_g3013.t1